MELCDCGAPVAFSPDGVHCLWCYEMSASRVVDENGELLSDLTEVWWWCDVCEVWHRGELSPHEREG